MTFIPSNITGLVAWWDAAQIVGLLDGDPVTTWLDLSGGGHSWSQSGAARPTYKTGVQGSPAQAIVRFDGSSSYLSANIGNIAQPYTVVILMAARSLGGVQFVAINSSTVGFIGTVFYDTGSWSLYQASGMAYKASVDTGFHTHIGLMNNAASSGRFDGAAVAGSIGGGTAETDPVHLGADYVPAQFAPIDVGVVLYYDRALTSTEAGNLETYLTSTPRAVTTADGGWSLYRPYTLGAVIGSVTSGLFYYWRRRKQEKPDE